MLNDQTDCLLAGFNETPKEDFQSESIPYAAKSFINDEWV